MDHNSTNSNVNTSPSTSLLPSPSPQLKSLPQESSLKYGRGLKITIWILCSIILGSLPLGAVALYGKLHSQETTLPALLIKGDLIAISIAIIGDAFGQTILTIVKKRDAVFLLIINIVVLIVTVIGLCAAFFVLSSFIGFANCTEQHLKDTSVCNVLGISDANVLLFSIIFYVGCILLGLIANSMEE